MNLSRIASRIAGVFPHAIDLHAGDLNQHQISDILEQALPKIEKHIKKVIEEKDPEMGPSIAKHLKAYVSKFDGAYKGYVRIEEDWQHSVEDKGAAKELLKNIFKAVEESFPSLGFTKKGEHLGGEKVTNFWTSTIDTKDTKDSKDKKVVCSIWRFHDLGWDVTLNLKFPR